MNPAVIPNLLSIFRILLIPPAVWLLVSERYTEATVVIALAVFTDGLDGFLARQYGWRSRVGGVLDPVADKLLFAGVFLTLVYLGKVQVWLAALVVGRDIVIGSGAFLYQKLVGPVVAAPSILSKINTLMLFFFTAALLLNLAGVPGLNSGVVDVLRVMVVITVVASGLQYVWHWGQKAMLEKNGHAS